MKTISLEQFRKWGAAGGKKSAAKMTKAQRIARARKAGLSKGKRNAKANAA